MPFTARLSARTLWAPLAIGTVAIAASAYYSSRFSTLSNEPSATFKGDDKWIDLKLVKFEDLSHDTRKFTFALNSPDDVSGLKVASLLLAKYVTPKGSNVVRPYTPVSDVEQKGTIDFVIKKYPTGKFGNHIFSLGLNDTVSFKGPIVKWDYKPNQFKEITLIGGGSGITPLYQLVHEIAKNPKDNTTVNLVYGNKTPEDILLKPELDKIVALNPAKVRITYFIDKEAPAFQGEIGFINKDWLARNIGKPSDSHKVFVCGPQPLYEAVSGAKVSPQDQGPLTGALKELGFTSEQVFKF